MKRLLQSILMLVPVFLLVCNAFADVVHLKNGNKMEGQIVEENEKQIILRTSIGKITLNAEDVEKVEHKASPLELYQNQAAKLANDDSVGHYFLGLWCKDKGLNKQAEAEFRKTIAINPDHAEARKELGYVMHAGNWVTQDEAMKAKGFVKVNGKWLTKEEASQVKAEERQDDLLRKLKRAARMLEGSDVPAGKAAFEEISTGDDPAVVVPVLSKIISTEEIPARKEAIRALGRLRTVESFDAIIEAILNERDLKTLEFAAGTLKDINSKRAAMLLGDAVTNFHAQILAMPNEKKPELVRAIKRGCVALGVVGEPMAVPDLTSVLVLKVDYIKEIENRFDIGGPVSAGLDQRDIGFRDGKISLGMPTTAGISVSTSVPDTELIPEIFNDEAKNALFALTHERYDFGKRKYLEWWAQHKPVFPPDEEEFELN